MRDFSRQLEVFNPEEFKQPVHVIGCGATGSWVAMLLAKLGIKDIHLHDFDIVEEHNLPNQLFQSTDVGLNKASATVMNIEDFTRAPAIDHQERVTGETPLTGIVFMLTDTMSSRAEIYKRAIKNNLAVPLLIETRMCIEGGRVYTINPSDLTHNKEYAKTLYSDDDAEVSACGISQSMAPTSALVASLAVWQLIKWHNNLEIDNEFIIDAKYNNYLTRRF